MLRLFIFAIISHFAYCFAFNISYIPSGIFNQTSVMYPLFIAVLVLYINEKTSINNILKHILVFILVWSAFPANWSSIAVLSVIGMYYNRGDLKSQMKAIIPWVLIYGIVSFFFVNKLYGIIQLLFSFNEEEFDLFFRSKLNKFFKAFLFGTIIYESKIIKSSLLLFDSNSYFILSSSGV